MRGRAALALSLVGVAAAGVAAGMVNDSVLRGDDRSAAVVEPAATNPVVEVDSTTSTTAPIPTTSTSAPSSIGTTTVASNATTTVASTSTTLVPTTSAPTTVPAGATVQSFTLGEGATVIVDTGDGRLDLVDIAPHPGWEVDRIDSPTHSQLLIDLASIAGVHTRFEMSVVHGIVSLQEVPLAPDADDRGSGDGGGDPDGADDPDDPDDDHSGPGGGDEPDDDSDDSDHSDDSDDSNGSGRDGDD